MSEKYIFKPVELRPGNLTGGQNINVNAETKLWSTIMVTTTPLSIPG